ncbi:unnamed protein product [Microthlaspi erraticum]|uniref:KIB1-4 beta-propeller domain-containing protein n=1 Tax=Microthlaspi erraticum TaxID=1685480 RepID=A0A6D2I7N4_9BRAS|nr:unnamed protein product [Microthlaspi erraticum]CAA7032997.1 unnamed protein product [Microthlaspi erraticum]
MEAVSMSPLPNMVEPETGKKTSSIMPDWSLLPGDLLHIIAENLENCFDVVHARSVCISWRSTIPFPSCLIRPSYSLSSFREKAPHHHKDLCTLEKIPLFLFRVRTLSTAAEYFMGGIGRRDESEDQTELPSPTQCSVKVKIGESDPRLMNMLDCEILPLGHQYRIIGWESNQYCRGVGFIPLTKKGGGEFVVLLHYGCVLYVLTSAEMKWKRLKNHPNDACLNLATFRGKFYASFTEEILVIDPYSLDVTPLMLSQPLVVIHYLVPSGNDELFLVERIASWNYRVSKLDEEAGKWVVVTDIGGRALLLRPFGNVSCSTKELPDGCGLSGNSFLYSRETSNIAYFYNYGLIEGGQLKCWKLLRQKRVTILSTSPVVAFRLEHATL